MYQERHSYPNGSPIFQYKIFCITIYVCFLSIYDTVHCLGEKARFSPNVAFFSFKLLYEQNSLPIPKYGQHNFFSQVTLIEVGWLLSIELTADLTVDTSGGSMVTYRRKKSVPSFRSSSNQLSESSTCCFGLL